MIYTQKATRLSTHVRVHQSLDGSQRWGTIFHDGRWIAADKVPTEVLVHRLFSSLPSAKPHKRKKS